MAWVEFLADFDWDPPEMNHRVTLAFRKGQVCFVRKLCAEAAIAARKALPTVNPNRPAKVEEDAGRR